MCAGDMVGHNCSSRVSVDGTIHLETVFMTVPDEQIAPLFRRREHAHDHTMHMLAPSRTRARSRTYTHSQGHCAAFLLRLDVPQVAAVYQVGGEDLA